MADNTVLTEYSDGDSEYIAVGDEQSDGSVRGDNWDDIEFDHDGIQSLREYRRLVDLYRVLPRDMFVTQIIRDYASSEPDLEKVRTEYFEHLKIVHVTFPYGQDAELKRRV